MSAKYIVIDSAFGESFHILPAHESHREVATKLGGTVLSAGFISIVNDQPSCFGNSESLDIGSRGDEDNLLAALTLGIEVPS